MNTLPFLHDTLLYLFIFFVMPCYLVCDAQIFWHCDIFLFVLQPQAQQLLARHCKLAINQHVDYKLIGSIMATCDTSLHVAQQLLKK